MAHKYYMFNDETSMFVVTPNNKKPIKVYKIWESKQSGQENDQKKFNRHVLSRVQRKKLK